jgi:hypothetical protein
MAAEHISPIEYCYDANRHAFLFLDMSHDTLDFKAEHQMQFVKDTHWFWIIAWRTSEHAQTVSVAAYS